MGWDLAVPDWRERIRAGQSLLPELPHLDRGQAKRAIAIFNKLRLPDVPGTPALAEAGGEWFREIVGALHGSVVPATRERMIREVFLLAPKKSSKTSYGAALMETTLLMNERPRAEFLLIAPTVSLAHIAFSQALGMVEKDSEGFLQKRMHIQEHLRKITDRRTKATLEIKAFDTSVLTGVLCWRPTAPGRRSRRCRGARVGRRLRRFESGLRSPPAACSVVLHECRQGSEAVAGRPRH